MSEPIVVGSTTYIPQNVEGIDYIVVQGYTLEDKDFAYQVKMDPRSNRTFYVSLAGKGSVWKLPDVAATIQQESPMSSAGGDAVGRARGVSTAGGPIPPHPAEVTVGTTVYVVVPMSDGTEGVILKGCDPAKDVEHLWAVRYDRRPDKARFYYSNQARGERAWALPEVPEDKRPQPTAVVTAAEPTATETPQPQPVEAQDPVVAPTTSSRRQSAAIVTVEEPAVANATDDTAQRREGGSRRPSNASGQQDSQAGAVGSRRNSNAQDLGSVEAVAPGSRRPSQTATPPSDGGSYRALYEDMMQRTVELQTNNSVLQTQLQQAEEKLTQAIAQHGMEAQGLRKHVDELKGTVEAMRTAECPSCAEKDRLKLQAENALLQGIREHTTDMMRKEEEKTKLYDEKSDWQNERLQMRVEIMTLQQKVRWQQEHIDTETNRVQTHDSDIAALKARIQSLQGDRDALQDANRQLQNQLDESVRNAGRSSRGGHSNVLSLECSAQTTESWLPRSRPTTETEREIHLLANNTTVGPYAQCCVCNAYRATLLCQECVQHEVQRSTTKALMASPPRNRTAPSATSLSPAPVEVVKPRSPFIATQRNPSHPMVSPPAEGHKGHMCHLCELRGAALARQREHIANLESSVARLQVEALNAMKPHLEQSPKPTVKISTMSHSSAMQTSAEGDVAEQLKDAKRQLKLQKGEIKDLRGLLTKHLSSGSLSKHTNSSVSMSPKSRGPSVPETS